MTDDARPLLVVTADLPCRRCGYALRGRALESRCPECGLPVEETLRSSIDLATIALGDRPSDPRRLIIAASLLAMAAFVGAGAGLLLPVAIAAAPVGFDPSGFGSAGGRVGEHLSPIVTAAGILSGVAFGLVVPVIALARGVTRSPRTGRAVVIAALLLAIATVIGLLPGASGIESIAEAATRGIGALVRGGGRIPATLVLVALAIEITRGLGVAFLVVGLADVLGSLGARSELYLRAGQGHQGPVPFLAATAAVLLAETGWLAATVWTGLGGLERRLDAIPWVFGWLMAAAITALGGGYLAMNALWAVAPWRRRNPQLDALVGPAADDSEAAAGMADDPTGGRSA